MKASLWKHLQQIQLADPHYAVPGSIDILLGSDVHSQIIKSELIRGPTNTPIAQLTKFGWVVSGCAGQTNCHPDSQTYQCSIDLNLYHLLEKFWKQEEVTHQSESSLTLDEQRCEQHFLSTHKRDSSGRYIVRLPFKKATEELGNSKSHASRVLSSLERKFNTNSAFYQSYSNFMKEYELLGHMTKVNPSLPEPTKVFYLPHHGVTRETSLTTKLRVVFNGSKPSTSGLSLNDILHTGPKLQTDLFNVLIWFRKFPHVFTADIEKMYRQIKVHQDDVDFQRILWKDLDSPVQAYQLTTVTYGLACAPYLAIRTLLQLTSDEEDNYPLAASIIKKGCYVDDIFGGSYSIEDTKEMVRQVDQLCMAGGFVLQKWASNHPSLLSSLPTDRLESEVARKIKEQTIIHTLGLSWHPRQDVFLFSAQAIHDENHPTKRSILSCIAQLFDPLGLVSPVLIRAKIFIQELWLNKLNWDDPLPGHLADKWTNFKNQLQDLSVLSIPRWINYLANKPAEIHGFSDASQEAMAGVVYLRCINNDKEIVTVTIIASKTKVTPLKRMTIPRLELTAAALLIRLTAQVVKILDLQTIPIHLWTDSSIAYTWITGQPSQWKDFVHNRVCYIQETLPSARWHLVPGVNNPADCATRGLTPQQLSQHNLWWSGPKWLKESPESWPTATKPVIEHDKLETRTAKSNVIIQSSRKEWDLLYRYSSLKKLLRVTVICRRAGYRFRRGLTILPNSPITLDELDWARKFWIHTIQHLSFSAEISLLTQNQPIPRSSPLLRLTPFIDPDGLLRIGGRLQRAQLSYDAKHPFILPRRNHLSDLLISQAHLKNLHGGTQVTLLDLRQSYWILGGRAPVRSFILKCVKCARYRQARAKQLMGQLPARSINPARPFLNSGIDYAGPLQVKTWKGRAAKTYKAYIALFICHATSAIHLELVTDCTTDAFLAAYKRFTARRGICSTLSSDCGTNLVGADTELKKLFNAASSELGKLATLLANDGTRWIFNPPASPHFGGKWEAGVKSVKYHLKRVVGNTLLTYEEMSTVLTQIEGVLNSRPLCPLSDDPDDLTALTPGHFLIGSSLTTVPEPSLEHIKHLSRWQLTRHMLDRFWNQWSKSYLQRHLSVYKWNKTVQNLKIGDLVLISDERYPPSKWPLARVLKLHPGTDGLVRVVTVKTSNSLLKRPIVKLCPLPIESTTS